MKKYLCIALAVIMLSANGCGVSQSDLDAAVAAKDSAEAQLTDMQSQLSDVKSQLEDAEAQLEGAVESAKAEAESLHSAYDSLEAEYAEYKESMKAFEGVEEAEAKARIAKAEQESESIEASKEAKAKEESKKAKEASKKAKQESEEKEKKGYDTGITYDQLARNPEKYEGEKIKFKGKVVQVIEDDDEIQIRLAVKSDYDTILFCIYEPDIVSSRVLEDDIITVYGVSVGTISYQSTMGGQITIPAAVLAKIDQ